MRWFQRGQADPHQPEPEPVLSEDDVRALARDLGELDRHINASAGRLPIAATPQSRRITDTLRAALGTNEARELDIHARLLIGGMVRDYLPTTLDSFLALDPATAHAPRPSGRTPEQSLIDQLDTLETSALEMLTAVRNDDADSVMTQGSFLQTKFSRSDLDL